MEHLENKRPANPLAVKRFEDIRAVTFDMGGTLVEAWPSVGHVYAEVAAKHGIQNVLPEDLSQRFVAAFRARKQSPQTASEWAGVVDETFAGLAAEPPSRTFFREIYERFAQASAWRVYDDVTPTLLALTRRGFKLALISNWDERLRSLLGELKLERHFSAIAISIEVGCRKPSKKIFRHAAGLLKLPSQSILHVGDSAKEDFSGARAAGFQALLLDRKSESETDCCIRRLTELTSLLK